jgi:hypothetical protein
LTVAKRRFGSWLCENSEIEISGRKFGSTSSIFKNKIAGQHGLEKTIEKAILRIRNAQGFSHSLGHGQTWRL